MSDTRDNSTTNEIRTLKDLLRRKDAEIERLTESEAKYRHLFNKSPVPIFVTDHTGLILDLNLAGRRLFGHDPQEPGVETRLISDFLVDTIDHQQFLHELNGGSLAGFQTRIIGNDGHSRDVHLSVAKREGLTGKLDGFEGFILDMTERCRIEAELRESEEKYHMVLESSQAGIYMFQDGGILSYVNPSLREMMGFGDTDDIIGRPFWEFIHDEDRASVKRRGLAMERDGSRSTDNTFRLCQKGGQILWVDLFAIRVIYRGKPAVVGNLIDITQIRQSEAEIRQLSQKLIEAIEDERKNLAADLHDEFGQALTSLQFDIKLIEQNLEEEEAVQKRQCRQTMNRIRDLAGRIRAISSRLRPELLDHMGLVTSIQTQVDLFNARLDKPEIVFSTNLGERRLEGPVELALYRVFQEALNNTIRHAESRRVTISLQSDPSCIRLIISDDGMGFQQNGNGLPKNPGDRGIGLLSMRERITALKGSIQIDSSRTRGTTIHVELPLNEQKGK